MNELEGLDSEGRKRRAEARLAASRPTREAAAAAHACGARIWEMGATATLAADMTLKDIVDDGRKH